MAVTIAKNGKKTGSGALEPGAIATAVVTPAMVVLDRPEPIKEYPLARPRLTNANLRAKAKTHKPPQSWFDKDEDGLY